MPSKAEEEWNDEKGIFNKVRNNLNSVRMLNLVAVNMTGISKKDFFELKKLSKFRRNDAFLNSKCDIRKKMKWLFERGILWKKEEITLVL